MILSAYLEKIIKVEEKIYLQGSKNEKIKKLC